MDIAQIACIVPTYIPCKNTHLVYITLIKCRGLEYIHELRALGDVAPGHIAGLFPRYVSNFNIIQDRGSFQSRMRESKDVAASRWAAMVQ